ncbi:MAG: hypothetical protein WD425_11415 [Nitrospirales bacterium]
MGNKRATITDPDLAKVGVALQRAAANARKLGIATNTPVYVFRHGKIVDVVAEHRTARSPKRPTAKSSQRKKTAPHRKTQTKKTS